MRGCVREPVGWVERQRNPSSFVAHRPDELMGFTSFNPSYDYYDYCSRKERSKELRQDNLVRLRRAKFKLA
jgi:hypothetical protein